MKDIEYIKRAMRLALRGKGRTSPNPLVGAVVVKSGRVVAEGYHHYCGGAHAEVEALDKAGSRARGATLYVTLEPCAHFGRTPPCVEHIIESGIRTVVIGMKDPNPLMNGRPVAKLRKAGIKVQVGVLEPELRKMNEPFIKYITKKMPFVVAKTAQTLDGKIATQGGRSKWITGPAARVYTHRLRADFDAILVGINTVLKDDPNLNAAPQSKKLKKIIVDSRLRLPLRARLFSGVDPQNVIVATTSRANKAKMSQLARKGCQVIVSPQKNRQVNLKWLFRELAKREIAHILIEGGATVISQALSEDLIDKLLIVITPAIMGDERALSSFKGRKVVNLNSMIGLKDLGIRRIGQDLLIEGYLK